MNKTRTRQPLAAAVVAAFACVPLAALAQPAPGQPDPSSATPGYQVSPGGPPPNGGIPSTTAPGGAPSDSAHPHRGRMAANFEAANTTRDGHLTLAQARAAKLHAVIRNFNDIDTDHKGYITLDQLRAYKRAHPHHRQSDTSGSTQPPGHF